MSKTRSEDAAVLVISNLGPRANKFSKHLRPLADVTGHVTNVRRTPGGNQDGVRYVEAPRGWPPLLQMVFVFYYAFRECYSGDYDVIVSISIPYGLVSATLGKLFGIPTHHRIIGAGISVHSKRWYQPLIRLLFGSFDSLSVHGQNHKNYLVSQGIDPDKITILPGSIDIERFQPDDTVEKQYDLIWVGSLEPKKRPLLFVDALRCLDERGVEFTAVIVGEGSLGETIESRLRRDGLADRVELAGWVDADEIDSYYKRSKAFVMTSQRDAFGFPLIESMAVGLAVVAPDRIDIRDGNTSAIVTHDKDGLLVRQMDVPSLCETLKRVCEDETLREHLGAQATNVRTEYSREQMRERWRTVVESLLAEKK